MKPPFLLRAGYLLAIALAAGSCARNLPETRFLNFDTESAPGALTSGWSGFEATDAGDTFAWAQAREARVSVLASGAADRIVRFRAWPFRWDGAPAQAVTVSVNGMKAAPVPLQGDTRVYSVVTPGGAWAPGVNVLAFEFAYAEAPKDRVPGATDTRTLAVAFDWLEILPVATEGARQP
jgi:hypothetical protein